MKMILHKIKKTVALAAFVLSAVPAANAWTAQSLAEFCQGNAMELIGSYGNDNSLAITTDALGVTDRNVSVGWGTLNGVDLFVIHNFMGAFDVYFTVSGNTIKAYNITSRSWNTTSGTSITHDGLSGVRYMNLDRVVRVDVSQTYNYYYGYRYVLKADQKFAEHNYNDWNYLLVSQLNSLNSSNVASASGWGGYSYNNNRTTWEGQIVEEDNGNVTILFGPYSNVVNSNSVQLEYLNSAGSVLGMRIIDSYVLTLFNPNAVATDSKNPSGYNVGFTQTPGDGYDFGISNFANRGIFYGNYNVNQEQYTGNPNAPYYEFDIIKGNINENEVVIPQQNAFAIFTGRLNQYNDESVINNTNYFTVGFDPATKQPRADKTIRGTITPTGAPHHDAEENTWHHTLNGGTRHTYENATISLDPFGFTDNATQTTSYGNAYSGMSVDVERDITFDCTLQVKNVRHDMENDVDKDGNGFYRADFVMNNFVNKQYVGEVGVYYVDGNYVDCSEIDVNKAKFVGSFTMDEVSDEITLPRKFYPIFVENPQTKKKEMLKDYTFFVRAKYKTIQAAPGQKTATIQLTDTHHTPNLVSLNNIPTSVDGVVSEDIMLVNTQNGFIVTAPTDCVVVVYNMAGIKIAEGVANEEITLPSKGIYVVKADTEVFKIVK